MIERHRSAVPSARFGRVNFIALTTPPSATAWVNTENPESLKSSVNVSLNFIPKRISGLSEPYISMASVCAHTGKRSVRSYENAFVRKRRNEILKKSFGHFLDVLFLQRSSFRSRIGKTRTNDGRRAGLHRGNTARFGKYFVNSADHKIACIAGETAEARKISHGANAKER